VGRRGVEKVVPIELSESEKEQLVKSANTLKEVIENSVDL